MQSSLIALYGTVEHADPWVAMLCEDHFAGSAVGMTAWTVIRDQFIRLRDGDRFWYENYFTGSTFESIRSTHLSDVIRRNTHLRYLPSNLFILE